MAEGVPVQVAHSAQSPHNQTCVGGLSESTVGVVNPELGGDLGDAQTGFWLKSTTHTRPPLLHR